jgi:lipopolysaccharide transport system ATP-binding protein
MSCNISKSKSPVLQVRSLSKEYCLQRTPARWWGGGGSREQFHALEDISFQVTRGEVIGIIGRNGAGKSTLLKILTRITAPTRGEADVFGRVGSLLEVGTGFHPELTGRENIFLNGSILGMRRTEIRAEFDAIVAFAGVEAFLDVPVKRYSSGMYVRLAFAVAAHLKSEILLVDEVLAVGDIEFQKRCLGKMRDVAGSGRTVLFVSHHLQSVAALCSRLLVLEGGKLVHDGEIQSGVQRYMAASCAASGRDLATERRSGSGELRVVRAAFRSTFFEPDETKILSIKIQKLRPQAGRFFISIHLVDAMGVVVVQCDSRLVAGWFAVESNSDTPDTPQTQDTLELEFRILTPWLKPGSYHADIFLCASGIVDRCENAASLEVLPVLPYPATADAEALAHGVVFADFQIKKLPSLQNDIHEALFI